MKSIFSVIKCVLNYEVRHQAQYVAQIKAENPIFTPLPRLLGFQTEMIF